MSVEVGKGDVSGGQFAVSMFREDDLMFPLIVLNGRSFGRLTRCISRNDPSGLSKNNVSGVATGRVNFARRDGWYRIIFIVVHIPESRRFFKVEMGL